MTQVSPKLRQGSCYYTHWCPGCKEPHSIYTASPAKAIWSFNGDVNTPSFSPSVRITYHWPDEPEAVCHYFLTAGELKFCSDTTHELKGQTVKLPDLPDELQGDKWSDG